MQGDEWDQAAQLVLQLGGFARFDCRRRTRPTKLRRCPFQTASAVREKRRDQRGASDTGAFSYYRCSLDRREYCASVRIDNPHALGRSSSKCKAPMGSK